LEQLFGTQKQAFNESDLRAKRRFSAFTQGLADLGWTDGRNVRMDLRWTGADTNRIRDDLMFVVAGFVRCRTDKHCRNL
jgi:hypothetical protein